MWDHIRANRFDSSYNRLRDDLANRVDDVIRTLVKSKRPELYGKRKTGPMKGLYTWELGRECRVLYYPDYNDNLIVFFRVCSHKEVYGP